MVCYFSGERRFDKGEEVTTFRRPKGPREEVTGVTHEGPKGPKRPK